MLERGCLLQGFLLIQLSDYIPRKLLHNHSFAVVVHVLLQNHCGHCSADSSFLHLLHPVLFFTSASLTSKLSRDKGRLGNAKLQPGDFL